MEESLQDQVLNWSAATSNEERFQFFKKLLTTFKIEEIDGLNSCFVNAKKRLKARTGYENTKKQRKEGTKGQEVELPASASAVPVCSTPSPWFSEFQEEEIFALDIEFVLMKEKDENGKGVNKAGKVSIVNFFGQVDYEATVRYKREDIIITKEAKEINGLDYTDFLTKNCKTFSEVRTEVEAMLTGKLVITVNGYSDFSSLSLDIGKYETFDLQSYYFRCTGQVMRNGEEETQNLSLATIYNYYYNTNINENYHTAEHDAVCTMKIFKEKYMPLALEKKIRALDNEEEKYRFFDVTLIPNRLKFIQQQKQQQQKSSSSSSSQLKKKKKKENNNPNNFYMSGGNDEEEEEEEEAYFLSDGKGGKTSFRPG